MSSGYEIIEKSKLKSFEIMDLIFITMVLGRMHQAILSCWVVRKVLQRNECKICKWLLSQTHRWRNIKAHYSKTEAYEVQLIVQGISFI